METKSRLLALPTEMRLAIWAAVGEQENFSNLLQVSKQIRSEVLHGIPGGSLSCRCSSLDIDSSSFNKCRYSFPVDQLTIIVDSSCSEQSWLTFSVRVCHGRGSSTWTVKNLRSSLARNLIHYKPRGVVVEFRAPKKGYYLAAFIILRAKLDNVALVLGWIRPQANMSLRIRFADPWSENEKRPAKPFWENCPLGRERHRYPRWDRRFPYFYEFLMTPLICNWAWRNATVVFDREPRRKSTSFVSGYLGNGQKRVHYHGYKELILANWGTCHELIPEERRMESPRQKKHLKFDNYEVYSRDWASYSYADHSTWASAFSHYYDTLDNVYREAHYILGRVSASGRAEELLSFIPPERYRRNKYLMWGENVEDEWNEWASWPFLPWPHTWAIGFWDHLFC
ncbi:hypothetical protein QBC33DRAFT_592916 [Phialemonium atrogriseum]|uniref:Uncharacterized protein n=1 Tax=Phialemonium atrogriseum TaxID=1093897 RepID=A0AAJ0C9J6_9PEZI|nr:uncharacterized protein QBC33DRAFT_592916 [Phialemonium atrogriseum]KAK1772037.1 hypothetical protein QBC33DRAFT_592916 [Phialemonium atrogriseum]